MKHKGIIALLLSFVMLCGCTSQNQAAKAVKTASPKALEQPSQEQDFPAGQVVASGANDFAFDLSARLMQDAAADENFICSPLSVWLPLAALTNATEGEAQETLLRGLGIAGATTDDINRTASRMMYSLTNGDAAQIANAYFIDKEYAYGSFQCHLFF